MRSLTFFYYDIMTENEFIESELGLDILLMFYSTFSFASSYPSVILPLSSFSPHCTIFSFLTNNHIYPYQIYRYAAFYLILGTFLPYEQVCSLLLSFDSFNYFSPIAVSMSSNFTPLLVYQVSCRLHLYCHHSYRFFIKQIVIFTFIFIFAY